jgi:ubiquinone/menaquinone biosynthesis C-methylase UbiE
MTNQSGLNRVSILSNYYKTYYSKLFGNVDAKAIGNKFFHKTLDNQMWKTAKHIQKKRLRILEVGAGQGEHLNFVTQLSRIEEYVLLDLQKPTVIGDYPFQVSLVQGNVENLPFETNSFDIVISTCVFHHLEDPLKAFSELLRVSKTAIQNPNLSIIRKQQSTIVIALPADPGFFNTLYKKMFMHKVMRKVGIEDPQLIYFIEHRNSIQHLRKFFKVVFKAQGKILYFPSKIPIVGLNAMLIFSAKL